MFLNWYSELIIILFCKVLFKSRQPGRNKAVSGTRYNNLLKRQFQWWFISIGQVNHVWKKQTKWIFFQKIVKSFWISCIFKNCQSIPLAKTIGNLWKYLPFFISKMTNFKMQFQNRYNKLPNSIVSKLRKLTNKDFRTSLLQNLRFCEILWKRKSVVVKSKK